MIASCTDLFSSEFELIWVKSFVSKELIADLMRLTSSRKPERDSYQVYLGCNLGDSEGTVWKSTLTVSIFTVEDNFSSAIQPVMLFFNSEYTKWRHIFESPQGNRAWIRQMVVIRSQQFWKSPNAKLLEGCILFFTWEHSLGLTLCIVIQLLSFGKFAVMKKWAIR